MKIYLNSSSSSYTRRRSNRLYYAESNETRRFFWKKKKSSRQSNLSMRLRLRTLMVLNCYESPPKKQWLTKMLLSHIDFVPLRPRILEERIYSKVWCKIWWRCCISVEGNTLPRHGVPRCNCWNYEDTLKRITAISWHRRIMHKVTKLIVRTLMLIVPCMLSDLELVHWFLF